MWQKYFERESTRSYWKLWRGFLVDEDEQLNSFPRKLLSTASISPKCRFVRVVRRIFSTRLDFRSHKAHNNRQHTLDYQGRLFHVRWRSNSMFLLYRNYVEPMPDARSAANYENVEHLQQTIEWTNKKIRWCPSWRSISNVISAAKCFARWINFSFVR